MVGTLYKFDGDFIMTMFLRVISVRDPRLDKCRLEMEPARSRKRLTLIQNNNSYQLH